MNTSPYQILPDLLPEEYESLRASIADRGVDIPIIVDEKGSTIDGFHREKACNELGVFCPREVRQFASEAEKYELVLRANCRRRQLSQKQRRELIVVYLRRDPQIADNSLGSLIGVSKNTVADVRDELIATCQIDKFEKLRGKDGKERPVKYRKIIANTPKEVEVALKIIGDLPESCAGKTLDLTTAIRELATIDGNSAEAAEDTDGGDGTRADAVGNVENAASLDADDYAPSGQELDDQTPEEICREIIRAVPWTKGELVLEPFRGDGNFYNNLPTFVRKDWCEIKDGRDFFKYQGPKPDTIITNAPFRDEAGGNNLVIPCLERCLQEALERVIYFVNHKVLNALTAGRLKKYGQWGWGITHLSVFDVHKWFGRYYLLVFEKDQPSIVGYFSRPGDLVIDARRQQAKKRLVAAAKGQQRLAEEQTKRAKLLETLKIWIEDCEDFMLYHRRRHPNERRNRQRDVRSMWKRHTSLDGKEMDKYLQLLSAEHQAMWKSLAG